MKPKRRHLLLRFCVLAAVGTALAGAVVLGGRGERAAAEAAAASATPPLRVSVRAAERADRFVTTAEFRGEVRAARRVELGFEIAGRLVELGPDDGDRVDAGEVLARLDTRRPEAERAELRARADAAGAELRRARLDRERTVASGIRDAVSTQDVDDAREAEAVAVAAAAAAQAAVARVEVELEKAVLRAPFAAVVARRHADPGAVLGPGEPVIELLDRVAPEARIGLAGAAVHDVQVGQRHLVVTGGREVDAVVIALLPDRDGGTRTVEAVLRLDADLSEVRPGDSATLQLARETLDDGFVLPLEALVEGTRGLWAVYVADADGRLTRRDLELLDSDGGRAFVRGTLATGDRVVIDGVHRLVPGLAVTVVEEENAAGE